MKSLSKTGFLGQECARKPSRPFKCLLGKVRGLGLSRKLRMPGLRRPRPRYSSEALTCTVILQSSLPADGPLHFTGHRAAWWKGEGGGNTTCSISTNQCVCEQNVHVDVTLPRFHQPSTRPHSANRTNTIGGSDARVGVGPDGMVGC